jgi:hypothetical protein
MPDWTKRPKTPADVMGNAVKVMRIATNGDTTGTQAHFRVFRRHLERFRWCGVPSRQAIGPADINHPAMVVFGKSAKLLADIRVAQWRSSEYAMLREAIQATIQGNRPDPRLAR